VPSANATLLTKSVMPSIPSGWAPSFGNFRVGIAQDLALLARRQIQLGGHRTGQKLTARAIAQNPACHYCGQPTERDSSGQFRWAHDGCVPKYEPPPPHPSMANPFARLLYEKMSAISEDIWRAGWLSGNEYALWENLQGDQHDYGPGAVAHEDLDELRVLSQHAKGWIWTGRGREHTPQLVTFAQWDALFAEASKAAGEAGAEQRDWTDLELPEESE
jgi:hypothetical protein